VGAFQEIIMTAALAMSSTSSIAIERFIAQPRRNAEIIPFPSPAKAEPVANDNAEASEEFQAEPEVVICTGPATALIERAALTKAVEIVDRIVAKRNTIPILSNLRMVASGGELAITGTDLGIEITATVPAAVDQHFATTLPAKLMKDLLKKATASDFVAVTTGDGRDTLDFERVDYRLQSLPATDYPDLRGPDAATANVFTMTGSEFFDGIDSTIGAMSSETTRYYLCGVYVHVYEYGYAPQLRFVSTDGHRLYRRDFAVPAGAAGMPGVIVSSNTVAILHALTKGKACPDSVKIEVTEARVRFTFGNVTVTAKTVDGTYPDYMRAIPAYNDKMATFDVATMQEALRAVSLISSERGRAFKIELSSHSARLTVNNPDQGSAKADIVCDYANDTVEIGFNAGYMADILSLVGDSTTFAIADAASPTLVTGSSEGFSAVLMPMRT
jgi:DNA polymerase III subunit beta